ncbi:MAG: hypothetical protein AAFY56_20495, partial [Pseudomonadota bacterium]
RAVQNVFSHRSGGVPGRQIAVQEDVKMLRRCDFGPLFAKTSGFPNESLNELAPCELRVLPIIEKV